jgi:hypothetical protein
VGQAAFSQATDLQQEISTSFRGQGARSTLGETLIEDKCAAHESPIYYPGNADFSPC